MESIPWKRVEMALSQFARDERLDESRVRETISRLPELVALCGHMSQTRKVAFRIGQALVLGTPRIVVPVCPSYTHRRGKYTYQGVNGGIPLLVRAHTPFLQGVLNVLPRAEVSFLIAEQEAECEPLCRVMGITEEDFRSRVQRSVIRTRHAVEPFGWVVTSMVDAIPDWKRRERRAEKWIWEREAFHRSLHADVVARTRIYEKIGYHPDEYFDRSLRTAAQYVALGTYCRERGWLIANHETPSLSWYLRTLAGFLHNPIKVY